MHYRAPEFNVIVTGPSRTGSSLIRTVFVDITKLTPILRRHDENIKPMGPKELLHSHNPFDVNLGNNDTLYIVSKRNLVESTYSNLIGMETNTWRYWENTGEIKPFYMEPRRFLNKYEVIKNYYKVLKPMLPPNTLILDYKDFADDITKLFELLNLPIMSYKMFDKLKVPTKTPGTYKDWILNFDEIETLVSTLDTNPNI